DPGAHAGRELVPLAHVVLRHLVVPAVLDEPADRDAVADERDVEDGETGGGEPECALSEALARERTADDPGEDVPAEPGREQGPAADDHHVRVRAVPHEMSRVAGAGEVLGHPREVLDAPVDAP